MSKLIEEVRKAGVDGLTTEAGARSAVEAVTQAIANVAASGDTVVLRGFGTFKVKNRAARKARNPRTGEAIHVASRDELTFKASR